MHLRSDAGTSSRGWLRPLSLLLIVLCMGLVAMPGCGGCWSDDATTAANKKKEEEQKKEDEAKKKKKKKAEKPKADFEPLKVRSLPSNDPTPAQRTPDVRAKPGHWVATSVVAKANNFDFPGELICYAEQPATMQPLEIEHTTSRLAVSRPASLPKGQNRPLPSLLYLPRRETGRNYSLRFDLRGSRGGSTQEFSTFRCQALADYEHLIVVLASNPAAYTNLEKVHSVKMPAVEAFDGEPLQHYYVILPNVEKSAPLPAYPLAWTSIAYVLWDDINPDVLNQEQQQALIDWIHWGGQLIISGPGSLDKLKGKPLAAYLPGESSEAVKLDESAFDELNRVYSLPDKKNTRRTIQVLADRPMVGVNLKLHPDTLAVDGTGGLVVERRVGGGRIVVTRFPLTDVRIKQWKNFDGFLNSALLRRPARKFIPLEFETLAVEWADPQFSGMLLEPRLGSTLRYFTRDIGALDDSGNGTNGRAPLATTESTAEGELSQAPPSATAPGTTPAPPSATGSGAPVYGNPPINLNQFGYPYAGEEEKKRHNSSKNHPSGSNDWHLLGYESQYNVSGVAGWNDTGAASEAARKSLTNAAGIEIPQADFVMKVLAIYLVVLVPLNWLVFWLLGRVEWAWIAAPLIAVVGAGAVIRLAQLDIGFARSRTEIAVLEVQGDYDRAHLTRYTALYTSLSSTYGMTFDDQSALALPFSSGKKDQSFIEIQSYTDVLFNRDKVASLTGVKVSSNSTGMVHSEQMFPLQGKLTLVGDEQQGFTLKNTSQLTVREVGVIRRRSDGTVETAYVAKLEPESSVPLGFAPSEKNSVWLAEWNQSEVFRPEAPPQAADSPSPSPAPAEAPKGRVKLSRLAQLATQQLRLVPGDVRLIGWTDEPLGGLRISPEAPQNSTYTLVLAHLVRGALPRVLPDRNVADDYLKADLDPDQDPNASSDTIDATLTPEP